MAQLIGALKNYGFDAYFGDLTAHGYDAVLEKQMDLTHGYDAYLQGTQFARRRVKGKISIASSLQDLFFGVTEVRSVRLKLDNLDGALDFLDNEEARGKMVRIRRYNETDGELFTVFNGNISTYGTGDEVEVEATSHDLDAFQTSLPRHRVATQNSNVAPDVGDLDVTTYFPSATDIDSPIPIVFGRTKHVPMQYVLADNTNRKYDYLVCEGTNVDVEAVYREGKLTYSEYGTITAAAATTVTLPADAEASDDFYPYLYIKMLNGDAEGEVKQITDYDGTTKVATIESAWTTNPSAGDSYEIREYKVLAGTEYKGRTAIRFKTAQDAGGSLPQMNATVVRYVAVKKNKLYRTEEFDHSDWSQSGTITLTTGQTAPSNLADATRLQFGASSNIAQSRLASAGGFPAGTYTFSIYMKSASGSTENVQLRLQEGAFIDSQNCAVGTSWTRFSVSNINIQGAGIIYVSLRPVSGTADVHVWGAQLEKADSETFYEPVKGEGQGYLWSPSDAIREILSNKQWGLGLSVNKTSFEDANTDLGGLFLKVRGSIPDPNRSSVSAQDLIDEILQMRGMRLTKLEGSWEITVDSTQTSSLTLGTNETPYRNIISFSPINKKRMDDAVKTLEGRYELDMKEDYSDSQYRGFLNASVSSIGKPKEMQFNLIRDANTMDRTLQYLAARMALLDKSQKVVTGTEARALTPGDIVTLIIPRRQPANLLTYSEDLTSWTLDALNQTVTASLVGQKGPEDNSRPIYSSRLVFPTPTVSNNAGARITSSTAAAQKDAIFKVWLKPQFVTDTPSIRLALLNAAGDTAYSETVDLVGDWKQYTVRYCFDSTVSGNIMASIESVLSGSGGTVDVWQPQLVTDYEYPYRKTTTAAQSPSQTWQVTRMNAAIDKVTLDVVPYNATDIFAYTASTFPNGVTTQTTFDASRVLPPPPGNFTAPENPGGSVANAGYDESPEGDKDSWGEVSFTMPNTSRITKVIVQRRKSNDLAWEDVGTIMRNQYSTADTVKVMVRKFTPGLQYEMRALSQNSAGRVSISATDTFIAHGDATTPDTPTGIVLAQGSGKNVQVEVTGTPPIDWKETQLFRHTSDVAGSATKIDTRRATVFHDADVNFDTVYYYWAKFVDWTGNVSEISPSSGHSIEVEKIASTHIESLTAGQVLTGTLLVDGGTAGITAIQVKVGSGSEIEFLDSLGSSEAHMDVDAFSRVRFYPETNNTGRFQIGDPNDSNKKFTNVDIHAVSSVYLQGATMVRMHDGTNYVGTRDEGFICTATEASAVGSAKTQRIKVVDQAGSLIGYLALYNA